VHEPAPPSFKLTTRTWPGTGQYLRILAGSCLGGGGACRKSALKKRCPGSESMVGNRTMFCGAAFSGNQIAATCRSGLRLGSGLGLGWTMPGVHDPLHDRRA